MIHTYLLGAACWGSSNRQNKKVIFKNCAPFTDCMKEINNTQIDIVKALDVVMLMHNLLESSNNYSKTS